MTPPGRRKPGLSRFLTFLLLLFFSTKAAAASAALGIDFGTEYFKAAIAKPGSPIEIVLTKDSKRKEAASLAFKPSRSQINDKDAYPERLYGGDAIALSARYPADVYPNLKGVMGLVFPDPIVQEYGSRYPSLRMESIKRDDSGESSVGFKSSSLGRPEPFMVEELLAMEFRNIKANAEVAIGKNSVVTDAVITYPSFYTAEEKRAIEQAAELAGLKVLGLISDGLAVGLNYATTRTFDSISDGAKPEYHVVYDMGAGSTSATVLKFQGRTIKGPGKRNQTIQEVLALGMGFDRSLGGDTLNDVIVQDMITKFLETPKVKKLGVANIHVRQDGKTMARLWKDAERVRQVLSANTKAAASFEGLFNEDVNFKYSLTRGDLELLAESWAEQIINPVQEALQMADLTLKDLDSIILHGGMTRTPLVQQKLEKLAGSANKIKTNVNADEAAAFGAAFKAAGLSPSFRVKDIRTADISGFEYGMSWSADGRDRQQRLFVKTSQTGQDKQITIKATEDLKLDFVRMSGTGSDEKILAVEATNLTKSANELKNKYGCAAPNITTVFNIRLSNFDGLPEIVSGSVSCKPEKGKDGGVMDNVKGLFGFGSKKSDQERLVDEGGENSSDDATAQTPIPVDDPTSSGTTMTAATASAKSEEVNPSSPINSSGQTKPTPSVVTIPLSFKTTVAGRSAPPKDTMTRIKQRLADFDNSDKNAALRSEALNVLEAFTYRARDYLEDESFITYSTEKVRKELESQLSKVSDWLYGDGIDAKLQEFRDKLKELKILVDPVLKRREEGSTREQAVETLKSSLSSASSMIEMIKSSIERAAEEAAATASSLASEASVKATATPSAKSEDDDLDGEPYTSTIDAESVETGEPMPKPYSYTEDDLSGIQKIYDNVQIWLDEKLALQEKLPAFEDPALLVAEIEAKSKQLQNVVSDTIMKQVKMQQSSKPKKSKTQKAEKAKTKKGKSQSSSGSSTVSGQPSSSSKSNVKDEL